MRSRRIAAAVVATATATLGLTLLTPVPSMADVATVSCDVGGPAPGPVPNLYTWDCELSAPYTTNEYWSGAQVTSQGSIIGKGVCRPVTLSNAYYIHVRYVMDAAGDLTTTTSPAFTCSGAR